MEQQGYSLIAGGNAKWWSHRETLLDGLLQNEVLSYNQACTFTSIYPRKMKTYVHTKICTGSFSEAFILNHQKLEPVNKSFNIWMDKQTVLLPQVEYSSVIKRNDCLYQCIKNNWQNSTPFPDKNNKLGIEVNYLNTINALYEKPSVNIILGRKRQKPFSLRSR